MFQQGGEFDHVDTWGEQLQERVHPVICVMDVESGIVSILENVPENLSPGQVSHNQCRIFKKHQ